MFCVSESMQGMENAMKILYCVMILTAEFSLAANPWMRQQQSRQREQQWRWQQQQSYQQVQQRQRQAQLQKSLRHL